MVSLRNRHCGKANKKKKRERETREIGRNTRKALRNFACFAFLRVFRVLSSEFANSINGVEL